MKPTKLSIYIILIFAASCYSINFSINFPIPLLTATEHFGDGISDSDTSYLGINMIITSSKIYSELNWDLLIPIIWNEGKWSDLESEKNGNYISGTAQFRLTDNDKFNFYVGPSAFGFTFNEDEIDKSYFGGGLSTTCTYAIYSHNDDIAPMTCFLSFSLNTDGYTLYYSPKITFVSFGFHDNVESILLNVHFTYDYQISNNYTYSKTGIALGFVF